MARAKTKMINIRTTPEIHQQIKQRASQCGTSISSFLTGMGLHGQVVMMEHLGETARDLKGIQKKLADTLWQYQQFLWEQKGIYPQISHAFEKRKSIITNAKKHRNKRFVVNIDLD